MPKPTVVNKNVHHPISCHGGTAGEAGETAKARLLGAALGQAMQAFKAALPGRSLADFRLWLRAAGAQAGLAPALAADYQACAPFPAVRPCSLCAAVPSRTCSHRP